MYATDNKYTIFSESLRHSEQHKRQTLTILDFKGIIIARHQQFVFTHLNNFAYQETKYQIKDMKAQ